MCIRDSKATGRQAYQYTSLGSRSVWGFLSSSDILELQEDDVVGLQAYQDNGPNASVEGGLPSYMNILRLA